MKTSVGDSVICAAVGWLISAIAVASGVMIAIPNSFSSVERWLSLMIRVIFLGAPIAFVTWLLIVLPLYIWVAQKGALWRPAVSAFVGLGAGAVAYVYTLRFIGDFHPHVLLSAAHPVIGAIAGAAIFTAGGWVKRKGVSLILLRWIKESFHRYDNANEV